MTAEVKMIPALIFYLLYLVGVVFFAVSPTLPEQHWMLATGFSLLLGLVACVSYGLINMVTLKDWSITLTLVDIVWGVVVTAVSAVAGFYGARVFSGQ